MTDRTIALTPIDVAIMRGDVRDLAPADRIALVRRLVDEASLRWGGSPPVQLITTDGRLVPYITKAGADQLAALHGVSITGLEIVDRPDANLVEVTAQARAGDGRTNVDTGACEYAVDNAKSRSRARMVAATRARRRVILGLVGTGFGWSEDGDRAVGLEDVE